MAAPAPPCSHQCLPPYLLLLLVRVGAWGLLLVPVCAGSLVRRSVVFSLERHLLWTGSHTVSWGQQCRWSEQQTAWVKATVGLCGFQSYLSTRKSG